MAIRKLYVYSTGRKLTTKITMAFAKGASRSRSTWEVKHMPISDYLAGGISSDLHPGIDAVATLGVLRGTGLLLHAAKQHGIDSYYMDHAYFNSGYTDKCWMRIQKNGHSSTTLVDVPSDRWKINFKSNNSIMPWKLNHERGTKIIICPPTHAVSWYMGIGYDWAESIETKLKTMLPSDEWHRIVIRRKPNEPIVDKLGNLVEVKKNEYNTNFNDELVDAHCVISYNSNVALQATLMGIPVISSSEGSCYGISFSIDDFASGPYPEIFNNEPNRAGLVYWLSYNQWRLSEIEDGSAWQLLQNGSYYD